MASGGMRDAARNMLYNLASRDSFINIALLCGCVVDVCVVGPAEHIYTHVCAADVIEDVHNHFSYIYYNMLSYNMCSR